jgi:hypothetical protein
MPIIKKVTTVGAGRGICLPKSWLEWIERQTGQPLREVLLEVDNTLTIIPFIDGKQKVKSKDEY